MTSFNISCYMIFLEWSTDRVVYLVIFLDLNASIDHVFLSLVIRLGILNIKEVRPLFDHQAQSQQPNDE